MNGNTNNGEKNMTETVSERIERLGMTEISEARLETLTIAHPLVDDAMFRRIRNETRVCRDSTEITLPPQHLETLSRGRGWARLGKGKDVVWGERVKGGYRVGPGRWVVGATDGYSRKRSVTWDVEHIQVGGSTWTVAS